jgi:hypothetical protein
MVMKSHEREIDYVELGQNGVAGSVEIEVEVTECGGIFSGSWAA